MYPIAGRDKNYGFMRGVFAFFLSSPKKKKKKKSRCYQSENITRMACCCLPLHKRKITRGTATNKINTD